MLLIAEQQNEELFAGQEERLFHNNQIPFWPFGHSKCFFSPPRRPIFMVPRHCLARSVWPGNRLSACLPACLGGALDVKLMNSRHFRHLPVPPSTQFRSPAIKKKRRMWWTDKEDETWPTVVVVCRPLPASHFHFIHIFFITK